MAYVTIAAIIAIVPETSTNLDIHAIVPAPNNTPAIGNTQQAAHKPAPIKPNFLKIFFESFLLVISLTLLFKTRLWTIGHGQAISKKNSYADWRTC